VTQTIDILKSFEAYPDKERKVRKVFPAGTLDLGPSFADFADFEAFAEDVVGKGLARWSKDRPKEDPKDARAPAAAEANKPAAPVAAPKPSAADGAKS
jgi:hypothetical protein